MPRYDNHLGGVGLGLAAGAGVLVLAPIVLPLAVRVLRPIAKAALETGILLGRGLREAASELVAEARAQLAAARAQSASDPGATGPAVGAG
jgi:hypothetical protein